MPNGCALVNHKCTGFLENLDDRPGIVSCSFKNPHAGLKSRPRVPFVVRRNNRRKQRDVDTKCAILGTLLGDFGVDKRARLLDSSLQLLWRRLRQGGHDTQCPCVRCSGRKSRRTHPLHATHHQRHAQTQRFSQVRLDRHRSVSPKPVLSRDLLGAPSRPLRR